MSRKFGKYGFQSLKDMKIKVFFFICLVLTYTQQHYFKESCSAGYGRTTNPYLPEQHICVKCQIGTYNWDAENTGDCTVCPTNAICYGNYTVYVSKNYWIPAIKDSVSHTVKVYNCPYLEQCCPDGK
jgi:hypothetical protein